MVISLLDICWNMFFSNKIHLINKNMIELSILLTIFISVGVMTLFISMMIIMEDTMSN